MRAKLEVFALVLGFIGLVGTVTITALPNWRVSAFIGANLIVMEELWEGLWMTCIRQLDLKMQCKVYDSLLSLPPELQAARALTCVSIALAVIALFVASCGAQTSNYRSDRIKMKNVALAVGGSVYVMACVTTLISVSWVTHTIVRNFYNPIVPDSQKHELGDAIFIGWATAGVLLVAGTLLLFRFCKRRRLEDQTYNEDFLMAPRSVNKDTGSYLARTPSGSYRQHEYV